MWEHSVKITKNEFNNIVNVLLGTNEVIKLSKVEYDFACENLLFPLEITNKETLSKLIKRFVNSEIIEVTETEYVNIKKDPILSAKLIPIQIFCINNAIKLISIEEGLVIYTGQYKEKNYIHYAPTLDRKIKYSLIDTRFNSLSWPNVIKFQSTELCICIKCIPNNSCIGYYGSDGALGPLGNSRCFCGTPQKACFACRVNNDKCYGDKCKGLLLSDLRNDNYIDLISNDGLCFIKSVFTNWKELPKLCQNHLVDDIEIDMPESDIIKIINGVRRNICVNGCVTETIKFAFIRR
jgi:hypothetical protein